MTNPRLQAVALACERDWRLLFEGLELDLGSGTLLQVAGPNGSGKTSLVRLVPRFYEPSSGRITLDGVALDDYRLDDLRRQRIGVDLQPHAGRRQRVYRLDDLVHLQLVGPLGLVVHRTLQCVRQSAGLRRQRLVGDQKRLGQPDRFRMLGQFGNTANVIGINDSSKLNVFTSHTLGMVEGRHLKASDKHMSMVHEDLAKTNGLKVGDTLTLKANPYDADNESHSTATVKTTIVGIFKGDSDRKVSSRAELTSNTVYTDLDTTSTLYQYKAGKEIYQDATFVLDRGVDVEKTMEAAKKLPVDWNNYQITRNDQYTSSMLNAARGVRSMMRSALIGVTISAVIVLSLMLLLWMNDRRQEMGVLVSLGIGKPSLIAQYLTEMILIGLPSLVLGWLCARGAAQWLGTSALRSVNASAAKELSSMGQVGGDLESSMSVRTLDSLTVSVDGTAMLYVALGLLAVMLVCVAVACMPMLRKSPRDLSEIR